MNNCSLFTDVSVNPQLKLGVGAYLILPKAFLEISPSRIEKSEIAKRIVLRRFENTSSTKLEVETVLWALENCSKQFKSIETGKLHLYSDSQCILGLLRRRMTLEKNNFVGKKTNNPLKNASLYNKFYELYDKLAVEVIKVTGHSPSRSQNTVHRIFSIVDREARKALSLWLCFEANTNLNQKKI